MASEEAMRDLLQRIAKLEKTVEKLQRAVQTMGKARRDTALAEVDHLERAFEIRPRTATLRRRA